MRTGRHPYRPEFELLEPRNLLNAGSLDLTFGGGTGLVTSSPAVAFPPAEYGSAVAFQSDGKILVGGTLQNPTFDQMAFTLRRFHPDGSPDTAFGAGGLVTVTPTGIVGSDQFAVKLQPDAKIVVAGKNTLPTGRTFLLARLNSDGSFDTTFGGGDGMVDVPTVGNIQASWDFIFVPDDQGSPADFDILTVGFVNNTSLGTNFDFSLARYHSDGTPVTAWGTNGVLTFDFLGNGQRDSAYGIALDGNGKVVVGGYATNNPTNGADIAIARLNLDGTFDTSFGVNGKVTTNIVGNSAERMMALALQPDGKIVAAGFHNNPAGTGLDFLVVRYGPDGTPDPTFGSSGRTITDFGGAGFDQALDMTLQDNGKIVVTGKVTVGGQLSLGLARYGSDGALDSSFGAGGLVTADFGPAQEDAGWGLNVQADGNIVVAGYGGAFSTNARLALARFIGNEPPTADAGGDYTVTEGDGLTLDGSSSSDPDRDTLSYSWDINGDGTFGDALGVNPTLSRQQLSALGIGEGPNTFTVTVRVADGHGHVVEADAATLTVTNVPPRDVNAGTDRTVTESALVTLHGTFTGHVTDTLTFRWRLVRSSNGQAVADGTGADFSFRPLDNGVYTLQFVVTDDDGSSASDTIMVTARNVPPAAGITGHARGVRGQLLVFTLSAADVSPRDQSGRFTYAIDWDGNGRIDQRVRGGDRLRVRHWYAESGLYRIRVRAIDRDGGVSDVVRHAVAVTAVGLQPDPTNSSKSALVIGGTAASDTIRVTPAAVGGTVRVSINGVRKGPFVPTGHIIVYGQHGNDVIDSRLGRSAWLHGGPGHDTLLAGAGADALIGNSGNDLLLGRFGRDLLIGGAGSDRLLGGSQDDILIGSATAFDARPAALDAILKEWTSGHDYSARTANLRRLDRGAAFDLRRNGTFFLVPRQTVLDDQASDMLFGNEGRDLFFAGLMRLDLLLQMADNETIFR